MGPTWRGDAYNHGCEDVFYDFFIPVTVVFYVLTFFYFPDVFKNVT